MQQWEYISTFLEAEARTKEMRQYIEQTFDKKSRRHSPEAMIPDLNRFGSEGWELVHMEPVPRVGGKEDVQFDPYRWSSTYFCVFKRLVASAASASATDARVDSQDEVATPAAQLDPNRIPY